MGLSSGALESEYTWRLFPKIHEIPGAKERFMRIADFHRLARAGQLPRFSFIEPSWTISKNSVDPSVENLFTQMGTDYHPPGNLIVAERFVKEIYASLIADPAAWNKTLLLITFDEFVGSFDHVAPPRATPPWGSSKPGFDTHGFNFDRLGARVPTILVSPWVRKGSVFRSTTDVPYDHTSVIATTLKWLGQEGKIGEFGERTRSAPTFEGALTLEQPRTDAAELGFLDVTRKDGDPVRYGDPIVLRNKNGKYITAASRTMKAGVALPSDDLMGFAVDLDLAAYFPTLGGATPATLSLLTAEADPPAQVPDGAKVFIITHEASVGAANFLGAWKDSHDCYYYNNYPQGANRGNERWIVRQVDHAGRPLRYGDKVHLENVKFAGQLLTHDTRPLQSGWVTTATSGDSWVIEPAPSK